MKGEISNPESLGRLRWCSALWFAVLCACLVYALDRSRAALFDPVEDPRLVIQTTRVPFFWRVYLALFLGSALGLAWGRIIPNTRLVSGVGLLGRCTPWCIALCALASIFLP